MLSVHDFCVVMRTRPAKPRPALLHLGVVVLCACDYAVQLGRECSASGCPGSGAVPLDASYRPSSSEMRDAGSSTTPATVVTPLSVAIQDAQGIDIASARLECGTQCLQVDARAEGGSPPYAFVWADGAATASRQLCPDSSQTYQVQVSDSVNSRPANASIRVERVTCGDAATAMVSENRCETYAVELAACSSIANANGAPQLRANQAYTLRLRIPSLSGPGTLQVAGMGAGCILTETLASMMLAGGSVDEKTCLRPTLDTVAIQLVALGGSGAEVLADTSHASFEFCEGCD